MWRDPTLTDGEKVLATIIADYYQECQTFGKPCKLSYSLIHKWTGWSKWKISAHIKLLNEKSLGNSEPHKKAAANFTSPFVLFNDKTTSSVSEQVNSETSSSISEPVSNETSSISEHIKNNIKNTLNKNTGDNEGVCSFQEKNQKQPSSEKYNIDEYSEIEKKVIAIRTKK